MPGFPPISRIPDIVIHMQIRRAWPRGVSYHNPWDSARGNIFVLPVSSRNGQFSHQKLTSATTSAIAAVAVVVDNIAQAVVSCSNPGAQVGLPGSLWIFRKTSKFLENDPFPVPVFGHPMYALVFVFLQNWPSKLSAKWVHF